MNGYSVKIFTSLNRRFAREWQHVWESSRLSHAFNSPAWFRVCLATFPSEKPEIYAFYLAGTLSAVAPLVRSRKFGIPVLSTPGGKFADRDSFLFSSASRGLASFVIKYLFRRNLFLAEIDTGTAVLVKKSFPESLLGASSVNPYLPLEGDPLRYMARTDLIRWQNKLKKHSSEITFTLLKNRQAVEALPLLFTVDIGSWKKRHGRGTLHRTREHLLFTNIFSHCPDMLRVGLLSYQGVPICYGMGLLANREFISYHTSYLAKYRWLQPGKITAFLLLESLQKEGVAVFNFSRGQSAYKRIFTPLTSTQFNVYYSAFLPVRLIWVSSLIMRGLFNVASGRKNFQDLINQMSGVLKGAGHV